MKIRDKKRNISERFNIICVAKTKCLDKSVQTRVY